MKKDVQFTDFSFMPKSQALFSVDMTQDLEYNSAPYKEINQARETFQRAAKTKGAKPEGRKTRDEKAFISKLNFILSHQDFTRFENSEDVLISLLTDSSTLFSRQYQAYEMNHQFFRGLRSEHGKTLEKELQYCRDYALRNVREGDQKKRYEHILSKLEVKSALEGWKLSKLESRLMSMVAMRQTAKGNPLFEIKRTDVDEAFMDALRNHRLDQLFYIWWKNLVYSMLPEQLCSTLEEWCPDIRFTPDEKESFPPVLQDYFYCMKRLPAEKRAAGHYVPSYTQADSNCCKEYLNKKHRLGEAVRRHKTWKPDDPEQLFNKGLRYHYIKDKETVCSKQISRALTEFLGKPCGNDEALECMVKRAERTKNIDTDLFPFHYLMVAVTDQDRLSSTPDTLGSGRILATCNSPYKSKFFKPEKEQKIKRIRLLHEVNIACKLSPEARSKNWNLFLRVHGTRIESKEEYDLWKDIIYPEGSDEAKENIPVMELTLLCLDCLETCLPNQMETLYCYHSGSPLHQGYFLKFIEQNSNVLDACVKRVKQKDWAKYKRKYLREWGKLECDPDAIWALCSERADLIRWGGISKGLNEKLMDFCSAAYSAIGRKSMLPERIEESVQELKSLLVETAFRTILKQEAVAVLAEQAEKLLNGDGYKISITNLEWL